MKRDVSQIRRNIAQRKRARKTLTSNSSTPRKITPSSFPQDEEKHGFLPVNEHYDSSKSVKDTFVASFVMKSILAAVLFFGVAVFFQVNGSWVEKPKLWTSKVLTEEFPFASVNKWYQEQFGSPLALTPSKSNASEDGALALPVNGTISQTFQMNGEGILISAEETSEVLSMEAGTVIFAGNDRETNKTVIIQHADKSKTIYGNLSSINVHLYQTVGSNDVLGEFIPSESNAKTVYFAIEKNNQFIDPVQVMQVDERP